MSGQWEVVGKKKEKNAGKVAPQKAKANGVKVEEALPIAQVKSFYASGKNNKENQKPQEKNKPTENAPKKSQKKPEKSHEPKSKAPKSIESALNSITAAEFNSLLEKNKSVFPETPIVWLKELAQFLNTRLTVDVQDPVFSNKAQNYPMSVMPTPLRNVMEKAASDAGYDNASVFFDICLTAMANDMNKDLPGLGHKFFLQYLASNNPKFATTNIAKYVSLRNSYQNRQNIGLSILWALGQAGYKDLSAGMKVFQEIMLPLIEMKNYSRFILNYLISLIKTHKEGMLTRDQYLLVLDVVYGSKKNISSDLNKALLDLLPKLNEMVTRTNEKHYSFVDPFLKKMQQPYPQTFNDQLCEVLIVCLEKDPNCLGTWGKVYTKYLTSSAILLNFIRINWKVVSKKINVKVFNELLKTFSVTNDELFLKKRKEDGLESAIDAIKKITENMASDKSSVSISIRGILLFLLPIIAAIIYYDVQKNGSWCESSVSKTLNMTGVYMYTNKAYDRAKEGTVWVQERIEEQFPGITDRTVEFATPYIELGRDLSIIFKNVVVNLAGNVKEKIPIVIEKIDSYVPGLVEKVQEASETVWSTTIMYYNKGHDYLVTEVFVGKMAPEEIRKFLQEGMNSGIDKASECYHWIYEKIASTIK